MLSGRSAKLIWFLSGAVAGVAAAIVVQLALTSTSSRPARIVSPRPAAATHPAPGAPAQSAHATATEPAEPTSGGPRLQIDQPTADIGTIWAEEEIKHTFVLRNVGDQTLEILKVQASCGCTVVEDYDHKIAPGAEGQLPVLVRTRGMQGKINKPITIWTNQPGQETTKLAVTGTIKRLIDLDPPSGAMFGKIQKDQALEKEIQLVNNADQPLQIESVRSTDPTFTAELKVLEPGQKFLLTVKLQPPVSDGIHRGQILLKTNLPQAPEYSVPVYAFLPERVTIVPRSILIFQPMPKPGQRFAFLRNEGPEPIHVLTCTSNNETLQTRVETREEGKSYRIVINLPQNYSPPEGGDKLIIQTDDPQFKEFVIPIVRSQLKPAGPTPTPPRAPASRPSAG